MSNRCRLFGRAKTRRQYFKTIPTHSSIVAIRLVSDYGQGGLTGAVSKKDRERLYNTSFLSDIGRIAAMPRQLCSLTFFSACNSVNFGCIRLSISPNDDRETWGDRRENPTVQQAGVIAEKYCLSPGSPKQPINRLCNHTEKGLLRPIRGRGSDCLNQRELSYLRIT